MSTRIHPLTRPASLVRRCRSTGAAVVLLGACCAAGAVHSRSTVARRGERAQSTVEYALVLLGAAAVALMVVAWATNSDAIGRLFDGVVGRVLQQAQ